MNRKTLSFEQIQPFVRHIHLSRIESDFHLTLIKAYEYRLIYIYDGKGYILVNGVKYNVSKGTLLFWQPGVEYLIYSEPSEQLVIIGVNFDFTFKHKDKNYPIPPDKPQNFNNKEITEDIEFSDMDGFNKTIYLKNLHYLDNTLLEIKNEYTTKKKYYFKKISGMFLSLLIDISRYVSSPNASLNDNSNTVDQILKYIHDNHEKPFTNRDIGDKFNFHANYINKLMVKNTGISLHRYLINCRISKAIHFIQTSNNSISEIAFMVGFNDINHFSKAFKSKTGESPKNFKAHSCGPI